MCDLLINSTPGVGKTHISVEVAGNLAAKQLVLITTQTGKNIEELYQLAMRLCPETENRIIRGRSAGTPGNIKPGNLHPEDANCYNYDEVEEAASKGFSPGLVVCPFCHYNDLCPYKRQFKEIPKKGLIIAAHESASTMAVKPDVWIIDESPIKAFLRKKSVLPGAFLQIKGRFPHESALVLELFQQAAENTLQEIRKYSDRHVARLYATNPSAEWQGQNTLWVETSTDGLRQKLTRDLTIFSQFRGETVPKYHQRLYYDEKINYFALKWLRIALGEELGVAYIQIKKDQDKPISYVLLHNNVPKYV